MYSCLYLRKRYIFVQPKGPFPPFRMRPTWHTFASAMGWMSSGGICVWELLSPNWAPLYLQKAATKGFCQQINERLSDDLKGLWVRSRRRKDSSWIIFNGRSAVHKYLNRLAETSASLYEPAVIAQLHVRGFKVPLSELVKWFWWCRNQ